MADTPPTFDWSAFLAGGPVAVTMPTYQTGNQNQSRALQQQAIQDLQQSAAGGLNTRAQQALGQSYGQARAGQQALGSAQRGVGGAAGLRHGQQSAASVQKSYLGDQQMLRLQEQQSAQALLSQLLQQQHAQDNAQAQGAAAVDNQGNDMNEQIRQFYANLGLKNDIEQSRLAGRAVDISTGLNDARYASTDRLMGNLANAGATALGTYSSMGSSNTDSSGNPIDDAFNKG